jgi:ABC-type polysaccharide/polyol phosphate export permease
MVSIVFFVLLFLSGLWYPIPKNSGLAQFSSIFPVRHLILATDAPFRPGVSPWSAGDLLVMAIWGVIGFFVALRRWSWTPRRSDPGRARRSPMARRD